MDEVVGESLEGAGEVGRRPPDVKARLEQNASMIYEKGLETVEALQAWLTVSRNHDARLTVTAGALTSNVGYHLGMTAAAEGWVDQLPTSMTNIPAATGAAVGFVIAGLDVSIGVVGGTMVDARMLNGECWNKLPASIIPPSSLSQHLERATVATITNVAKNVTRIPIPAAMGAAGNRSSRLARTVDVQVDSVGGYLANAANNFWTNIYRNSYNARMFLREDMGDVFEKSKESWGDFARGLKANFFKGLKSLLSTSVAASVVTITGFITGLFAANAAIEQRFNADYDFAYNEARRLNGEFDVRTATTQRVDSLGWSAALTFAMPMVNFGTNYLVDKLADYLTAREQTANARAANARAANTQHASAEGVPLIHNNQAQA